MKSLLATLALTTALTLPGLAMARPVTLTTTLNNYGGVNGGAILGHGSDGIVLSRAA